MEAVPDMVICCPHCGQNIDSAARRCPHCQGTVSSVTASSVTASSVTASSVTAAGEPAQTAATGKLRQLIDNKWAVLLLLFFVTAGIGLPVLWKSKGFTASEKVGLTVVMTIYTTVILWLIYVMLLWIGDSLSRMWAAYG